MTMVIRQYDLSNLPAHRTVKWGCDARHLHEGQISKEIARADKQYGPECSAANVVPDSQAKQMRATSPESTARASLTMRSSQESKHLRGKRPVSHAADASYKRRKCAHNWHKACQHDGLCPVSAP